MKIVGLLEAQYKPIFYHRHGSGQIRGSVNDWLKLMGVTKQDVLAAKEKAKLSKEYRDLIEYGLVEVKTRSTSFRFSPSEERSQFIYYNILPNGKIDASRNGHNRWNMPSLEPFKKDGPEDDPVEVVYETFVQAFKKLKQNLEIYNSQAKVKHRAKDPDRAVAGPADDMLLPYVKFKQNLARDHNIWFETDVVRKLKSSRTLRQDFFSSCNKS